MRAIETRGTVTPDGQLSVQVPSDIPAGEHRVVVVIDEQPMARDQRPSSVLPVLDLGPWPGDLSLRREDMYGQSGR